MTSVGSASGSGHRRYQVSWRLDDGSQGAKTVDSSDEARDLAAEKRLEYAAAPGRAPAAAGCRSAWLGR